MRAFLLTLAFAATAAGAAMAQPTGTSLTLQSAGKAPAKLIIDGAVWKCAGAECAATTAGDPQPASRACRRVVARLGPVTAFSWEGKAFSSDELAACNK